MVDTYISNGDCDACSECYAVEQGFIWVTDFKDSLVIDEEGLIYREGLELDGPVACEVYYD